MPKPTSPPTDTALVVEALRARAEQRKRACTALATELAGDKDGGRDVRSGAVKVVDELAAADRMLTIAANLEAGTASLLVRVAAPAGATRTPTLGVVPAPAEPEPAADTADLLPEHEQDEDGDTAGDDGIITVDL